MACYNPERGLCVRRAPCGTGTRLLRKQPCRPADVPSAFTHSYMYLCDFDIIMSMQSIAELRIALSWVRIEEVAAATTASRR